ncbi:MAG: hypothetical protein J7J76_03725 [Candidatus Latescibacteria bacterium]|nr:hypothetical protein [Candidatus Latescibacterota bacterium]
MRRSEKNGINQRPITLDVTEEFVAQVQRGERVVLRHTGGTVVDMWRPDFQEEARLVYRPIRACSGRFTKEPDASGKAIGDEQH